MNIKQKVIFTSPIIEYPPAGGPQLRIKNCIVALNSISELHLLSPLGIDSVGGINAIEFYEKNSFRYVDLTNFTNPSNKFISFLMKVYKKLFNKSNEDIYAEKIVKYAKSHKITIIWFGYGNISYGLISKIKKKASYLKLVCDTDSVWSRFISREIPFQLDLNKIIEIRKKTRQKEVEERYFVENCDITTAVSSVDADYYRSLAGNNEKIQIFSNAIDEHDYSCYSSTQTKTSTPTIFLGGTFDSYDSPMSSAARWVLDEVMPIVYECIPEVKLLLVGKGSDIQFDHLKDHRVIVTGKVDSVLPYLLSASVSIVPLKFESGTRFKILESGICRIPVVSTTLGAEGIPITNNKDILLADSSEAFAQAIIKCINEPEFSKKMASNCYSLVSTQFGIPSLTNEAKKILQVLKS